MIQTTPWAYIGVLGLLLPVGCKTKTEEVQPSPEVASSAALPPAATPTEPAKVAKPAQPRRRMMLKWDDPPTWKRIKPTNRMRKASYIIPKAKGDPANAELSVFRLGGSVKANIDRWVGQFQGVKADDVKQTERVAHNMQQHVVEIKRATFSGGMSGGPGAPAKTAANFGLLGGIIETPAGKFFFKMTGPSKTVSRSKAAFLGMLDSFRMERPITNPGDPNGGAPLASPLSPGKTTGGRASHPSAPKTPAAKIPAAKTLAAAPATTTSPSKTAKAARANAATPAQNGAEKAEN